MCCLVELVPPTPTQRPRSIASSSGLNASSSSSNRPARKRPCRTSRTEPISSNRPADKTKGTSLRGSSSLPSNTPKGSVKLDTLLQRFELLSTPLGPSRTTAGTSIINSTHATRSVPAPSAILRDQRDPNCQLFGNGNDISSPITRSSHPSLKHNTALQSSKSIESKPLDATVSPSLLRGTSRSCGLVTRPAQPPARTGMKSVPKSTGQKPFKPPFLVPPTRSSPRHLRQNITIPPSPLRAAALPVPHQTPVDLDTKASMHSRPTKAVNETPCRGKVRKHNANVDVGEDDPAGDSSFDSFDGFFQAGGPELEALLKTVDGSQ